MTSNIKVVDINEEAKQETNNETVEPVQEEEPNNESAIENSVEPPEELANEPPEVKPEPKKKEPPIPLDQPVKQNVRQQDKLVKCPKCDKQMRLKSYRYKHELNCKGKLEDIPRKPKAMPKPKVQPVMQSISAGVVQSTNPPVQQEEPHEALPVSNPKPTQPVQNQIVQPRNPLTDMTHHYQLLQQQFMQQKKEKYSNLCQNMFAPKSKKR